MIRLKNVSKFYYSKGVIATGFTKVNLELNMGEFVLITGESGSGKSTLLNVISGLDTYEEGEMYINGLETSHYSTIDYENYRRKYISNIYQNFNLINSYTVKQNIELVLLLNGKKKKYIKKDVIDIIKKVGLYKFRNTKASKLSGGQKQRVAIARALLKDTPVIIADEPTGNLDSKSSREIIKLLSDISKDKLVIVVTHNLDEIKEYATRIIKMNDGRIIEDKKITNIEEEKNINIVDYKNITFFNKIRLGLRNTFNIIPKFLLLLCVYLFITISLISEYSAFKKEEYIENKSGGNQFFKYIDDDRILIKKKDKTNITENDFEMLNNLDNVKNVVKNDLLIDTNLSITDNEYLWIYGGALSIDNFKGKVDVGRMPNSDDEIILSGNKDDYYLSDKDKILENTFYLQDEYTGEIDKTRKFKVVGIKYIDTYDDIKIYFSDNDIEKMTFNINQKYSKTKIVFAGIRNDSNTYSVKFMLEPNHNIKTGEVYISGDLNYLCKNSYCVNNDLSIEVNNIYYSDVVNLKVGKVYYKYNFNSLLGLKDFENNNGKVYISYEDYNNLYNKGIYQSSVFIKDVKSAKNTINKLNDMGFTTLRISDNLVKSEMVGIIRIFKTVVTIILVMVLFFICYFVTKLILKSRNVYFSTLRMLGASLRISKDLLNIELFTVSNIAYFSTMLLLFLNSKNIINVGFMDVINNYLIFRDYIFLYLILIVMSYVVSIKFSKKLFKNSAITTLNEEV